MRIKLYIKNMVCDRCIFVVKSLLNDIDLVPLSIKLGEIELAKNELNPSQILILKEKLESFGFELLDDKNSRLIEKIKNEILQYVNHQLTTLKKRNVSDYLSEKLDYDYKYISNLFSTISGVTIEHYLIQLKIEKVKELLFYNELTLNEIAFQMGYSSVAHLSKQFKKETGLTPSFFKTIKDAKKRMPLDKL